MSLENIPHELRELKQWVVWRLEKRDGAKPTKVPYAPWPGAIKASVTKPGTWGTFEQACSAPMTCVEPVDSSADIGVTGFSGVGFVFTKEDPYAFIDLDDTHGDQEAFDRQMNIFTRFNSYSEFSPSGNGLHIIIKANLPHGRRRADIELYSDERYATMTGNVHLAAPIEDRQELAQILFDEMGGEAKTFDVVDKEQTDTDEEIINRAASAANGDKFSKLWNGDFQTYYPSQSEADFALVDIIAFYTQNSAQIARLFRQSALGQRDKAQRDDYIGYMVRKSFDRQLPQVDIDGLKIALDNAKLKNGAANASGDTPAAPNSHLAQPELAQGQDQQGTGTAGTTELHNKGVAVNPFVPGLLGGIAQFLLDAAPRQVPEIALAGAIGLLSGITGKAYNISGVGLNQYILLLAATGSGKDLISSGTSKLLTEIKKTVPTIDEMRGPGELVSAPGLIKWINKKPNIYSILGEVGITLQQMAAFNASPHLKGLEKVMLQLYSKSGYGNVFDPMAYSDQDKNTQAINAPSFSLLGESVPDRFYEALDDSMIRSGLLPRFMIFEYKGKRQYLNEGTENIQPPIWLVESLANLAGTCFTLNRNNQVHNIAMDAEATKAFREFERWTTDQINATDSEEISQLWNRAHLKALKLAGVCAVGINMHNPLVTMNETTWATDMIVDQTKRLITKFETGAIGYANNAEGKQLASVVKVISEYINSDHSRYAKLQPIEEMHRLGVIPESYISRRLISVAIFRNDKMGATNAIKRALKSLLEGDELREIPRAQMQQQFGKGPKAYVVANPNLFMPEEND